MVDQYSTELLQIRELLRQAPHGMSVTEIARTLKKNMHSVGRYLDILHVSGQVEMRTYGKAKVIRSPHGSRSIPSWVSPATWSSCWIRSSAWSGSTTSSSS